MAYFHCHTDGRQTTDDRRRATDDDADDDNYDDGRMRTDDERRRQRRQPRRRRTTDDAPTTTTTTMMDDDAGDDNRDDGGRRTTDDDADDDSHNDDGRRTTDDDELGSSNKKSTNKWDIAIYLYIYIYIILYYVFLHEPYIACVSLGTYDAEPRRMVCRPPKIEIRFSFILEAIPLGIFDAPSHSEHVLFDWYKGPVLSVLCEVRRPLFLTCPHRQEPRVLAEQRGNVLAKPLVRSLRLWP